MGFTINNIYTILHKKESEHFNFTNPKRDWDGFCLITKGNGVAKNNKTKESYAVKRGNILLYRRDENYTLEFTKPCSYITSAFDFMENGNQLSNLPFCISCKDSQTKEIFEILDIWQKRLQNFDTICRIKLLEFYLHILIDINTAKPRYSPPIEKAIDFIHNNYKRNFSFNELSIHCQLSPSYLRSVFLKETRTTPMEYRMKLRLDMACEMLESEHFNLTEIASDLGFYDICHFSRSFKNYKGISPRNYYKNIYLNIKSITEV